MGNYVVCLNVRFEEIRMNQATKISPKTNFNQGNKRGGGVSFRCSQHDILLKGKDVIAQHMQMYHGSGNSIEREKDIGELDDDLTKSPSSVNYDPMSHRFTKNQMDYGTKTDNLRNNDEPYSFPSLNEMNNVSPKLSTPSENYPIKHGSSDKVLNQGPRKASFHNNDTQSSIRSLDAINGENLEQQIK